MYIPGARPPFVIMPSPWGVGGVLIEHGVAPSNMSEPVSADDIAIFGVEVGSTSCQKIVELGTCLRGAHANTGQL